jgi:hypothetical protein
LKNDLSGKNAVAPDSGLNVIIKIISAIGSGFNVNGSNGYVPGLGRIGVKIGTGEK